MESQGLQRLGSASTFRLFVLDWFNRAYQDLAREQCRYMDRRHLEHLQPHLRLLQYLAQHGISTTQPLVQIWAQLPGQNSALELHARKCWQHYRHLIYRHHHVYLTDRRSVEDGVYEGFMNSRTFTNLTANPLWRNMPAGVQFDEIRSGRLGSLMLIPGYEDDATRHRHQVVARFDAMKHPDAYRRRQARARHIEYDAEGVSPQAMTRYESLITPATHRASEDVTMAVSMDLDAEHRPASQVRDLWVRQLDHASGNVTSHEADVARITFDTTRQVRVKLEWKLGSYDRLYHYRCMCAVIDALASRQNSMRQGVFTLQDELEQTPATCLEEYDPDNDMATNTAKDYAENWAQALGQVDLRSLDAFLEKSKEDLCETIRLNAAQLRQRDHDLEEVFLQYNSSVYRCELSRVVERGIAAFLTLLSHVGSAYFSGQQAGERARWVVEWRTLHKDWQDTLMQLEEERLSMESMHDTARQRLDEWRDEQYLLAVGSDASQQALGVIRQLTGMAERVRQRVQPRLLAGAGAGAGAGGEEKAGGMPFEDDVDWRADLVAGMRRGMCEGASACAFANIIRAKEDDMAQKCATHCADEKLMVPYWDKLEQLREALGQHPCRHPLPPDTSPQDEPPLPPLSASVVRHRVSAELHKEFHDLLVVARRELTAVGVQKRRMHAGWVTEINKLNATSKVVAAQPIQWYWDNLQVWCGAVELIAFAEKRESGLLAR